MSRPRRQGPSPDGRHDDLPPDQWQALSLDVPDDPRELDSDRQLWLREEGRATTSDGAPLFSKPPSHGRSSSHYFGSSRRGQRLVVTAVVLLVSMVVITVSGLMASLALIPAAEDPAAAPLADDIGPRGQIGGLLPTTSLTEPNPLADAPLPVAAQSLRPAVIALVPDDCPNCVELLRGIRGQAGQYNVPLTLVGTPSQTAQLNDIESSLGAIALDVLTDPTGDFIDAFGNAQPTLVLVREDGVIVDVVSGVSEADRLDSALVQLVPSLATAN